MRRFIDYVDKPARDEETTTSHQVPAAIPDLAPAPAPAQENAESIKTAPPSEDMTSKKTGGLSGFKKLTQDVRRFIDYVDKPPKE